jgi:hypothetical protein
MRSTLRTILFFAALTLLASLVWPQVPTGTIAGTVTDQTGSVVPGASITVTNKESAEIRRVTSAADGSYLVAALPAGLYSVSVEASGFRTIVRDATVATGTTIKVDIGLVLGDTKDVVTVEAASGQINYESQSVQGVVGRQQIQGLPLNGRSFLNLAILEPGVTITTGSTAQYNALFRVQLLGTSGAGQSGLAGPQPAITVDGASVRDSWTGQTGMNFSQEVVQEFQVSTVNFDLSTGITAVGGVNIVTRSGGDQYHGSAYYFFRDHNIAAYPGLQRSNLTNDPFFARRNPGTWIGGPIKKDKLFFFFNYEYLNQTSAVVFQANNPAFAAFSTVAPSPYTGTNLSAKFDYRVNSKNTAFLRYSHDGNQAVGPATQVPQLPSGWLHNTNWSDQGIMGLTTTLKPTLVNDFRFSYAYWNNRNLFPAGSECPAPCIGGDQIQVTVLNTNIVVGHTNNAQQGRNVRRYDWNDNVTWQLGSHRLRFGGEFELSPNTGFWGFCNPGCAIVYNPTQAAAVGLTAPKTLSSFNDLLQLPLYRNDWGVGDPSTPAPFQADEAKTGHRIHVYLQDTWKIRPSLTLNLGLGYQYEGNLANYDLRKPASLAPIYGSDVSPTDQQYKNFSPAIGFAWRVGKSDKTVIRGGAGLFYDTQLLWEHFRERSEIGPVGNGRYRVQSTYTLNTLAGIPGVPVGAATAFLTVPTAFTLNDLMQQYGGLTNQLNGLFAPGKYSYPDITNFDVAKQALELIPRNFPVLYSEHFNIGVQREIAKDMVLTADFVSRQYMHTLLGGTNNVEIDYNHYNAVQGPAIPKCVGAQQFDPNAKCSTGAITFWDPGGRGNYRGLLVKLTKRFTNHYQLTASYALQSQAAVEVFSNNNWFAGYGPYGPRHVLNISGLMQLPWGFEASVISSTISATPVAPTIPTIDLDGDGSTGEPLPGVDYRCFNAGCGRSDLAKAVSDFNTNYAGKKTSRGQTIPTLVLPQQYNLGSTFNSQDLRISKTFRLKERYQFNFFGECFNIFNVGNVSGFNLTLDTAAANPASQTFAFGRPSQRVGQNFGSGGPRAFQVGGRFSF